MKIRNVTSGSNKISPVEVTKKNSKIFTESFKSEFENLSSAELSKRLEELKNDIVAQGRLICEKCDIKQFKKYKEMISSFFNEMVKNGFKYSKEGKAEYGGKKRIYANIKNVNKKLDALAQELVKEQKNQITIIQTVEDIRGIILDTFM